MLMGTHSSWHTPRLCPLPPWIEHGLGQSRRAARMHQPLSVQSGGLKRDTEGFGVAGE